MRAFRVTVAGIEQWSDLEVIVAAKTPGQAKADQYISANEAGFNIPFTAFRATRAPEFDDRAERAGRVESLGWKHEGEATGVLWAASVREAFADGS